jgi:hypothetical protein
LFFPSVFVFLFFPSFVRVFAALLHQETCPWVGRVASSCALSFTTRPASSRKTGVVFLMVSPCFRSTVTCPSGWPTQLAQCGLRQQAAVSQAYSDTTGSEPASPSRRTSRSVCSKTKQHLWLDREAPVRLTVDCARGAHDETAPLVGLAALHAGKLALKMPCLPELVCHRQQKKTDKHERSLVVAIVW